MNWVLADVTEASNLMRAFGTLRLYCTLFAVKLITPFVIFIVTGSVPVPNEPGSRELLNHIYLPAGMAVPLKLDVSDVLLIVQLVGAGNTSLTVTNTFRVLVQPLAVKVYTYVTLTGELVVLLSVSVILPVPLAALLLIPVTAARVQLNVVPDTLLNGT